VSRVVRRDAEPLVESTVLHRDLQRCTLFVDDSVAYWAHVDLRSPMPDRLREARRDRWFGAKFHSNLVGNRLLALAARYDPYPHAVRMLQSVTVPVELRPLVCHVHLALADARYRRFTGEYLAERRERGLGAPRPEEIADWLRANEPSFYRPSYFDGFAPRLLGAAREAGLVDDDGAPRELGPSEVPAHAVAYMLYLLREVRFAGTLRENAYLRGLGIVGEKKVAAAIEAAPGVTDAARGRGTASATARDGGVEFEEAGLLEWGEKWLA
jgi:hypothetical protein